MTSFQGSPRVLVLGLVAMAMLSVLPADSVRAAVYWDEGHGVGRANADGSQLNRGFIGTPTFVDFASTSNVTSCGDVAVNGSHVYWTNPGLGTVGRANLDGSDQQFHFIGGAQNPCGVAVDESHVYWTNHAGDSIGRAKLDGTEVDQSFVETMYPCDVASSDEFVFWTSNDTPVHIGRAPISAPAKGESIHEGSGAFAFCGLAIDGEHIYWGGFGDVIGKARIDGSEADADFVSGVERPCGVAVAGSHLYWLENAQDGGIGRVNLDGSNMQRGLIAGLDYSCGMAADSYVIPPPAAPVKAQSECAIKKVKRNRRKGIAFALVIGALQSHVGVKTRGVRFKRLSDPPPSVVQQPWRWWLKIWPRKRGKAARHIRKRLKHRGWARIRLRVRCSEHDKIPGTAVRRLTLRRVR